MKHMEKSLISLGHNQRAKDFIEKLKRGEEANVLFLGGSVTEGYMVETKNRFTTILEEYFKKTYGGCKLNVISEGFSGTDSIYGLVRAELNIRNHAPDLAVLEYAINDRKDGLYRAAFESMVVKLLESERQPPVLLLFVKSKVGYTCQGHMKQIGHYYQVPMVSVGNLLSTDDGVKGEVEWEDYSDDESHPNEKGHKLIADCLIHYFNKVREEEAPLPYQLPKGGRYGNQYKGLRVVCLDGWNGDGMEEGLRFQSLFVMYIEENSVVTGSADVFIDGEYKATLQGYSLTGWGRPVVKLVAEGLEDKTHSIHIRMAKGDEGKGIKLICLGFC